MAQPAEFPVHLTDGNSQHTPGAQANGYMSAHNLTQDVHSMFAKAMMKELGEEVKKGESEKVCFFVMVPAIPENAHCVESYP